ncbi:MAG: InlB B-repeat-containing protein, partial [Clostridiales bacterium]|nr:InlB B-repeat-containing protein [Clostridiales bacterium]
MTNQWKRLLSGMLALALAFSLFVPAMATSVEDETADDQAAVTDAVDDVSRETEAAETETDEADEVEEAEEETPAGTEEEAADTEADEDLAESPAQEIPETVPEETVSDETSESETDAVAEKVAAVVEADTAAQTVAAVASAVAEPVAAAEETVDAEPAADEDEEEEEDTTTSYVAEYNGTKYETLQDAFDAVVAAWNAAGTTEAFESISTITMLADVTEDITYSFTPKSGMNDLNLTLDMDGHTLTSADSTTTKGAIYVYRGSTLSNQAYLYFTVKNGTIANGSNTSGAGGVYGSSTRRTYLIFDNVTFVNNTGTTAGAVAGGTSIEATNCIFTGNTGTNAGAMAGDITATNCTFTGNTGTAGAGAIYSAAGKTLVLKGCTITGNSGTQGGGIKVLRAASSATTLDLTGSNVIYNNTASVAGDDIFVTASSGSKVLTVKLADASVYTGGLTASLYQDGTYSSTSLDDDSRYSEGNRTEVSGSVKPSNSTSSASMRSIGIKVVPVSYTVTYTDGVDGVELFADQVTTVASGAVTPDYVGETPTRTGYTFTGWTPEIVDTVTGDVTYTAVWTAMTYTITLDAGEGTVDPDSITVTYDGLVGELPEPAREGYTFTGWVDADGNPVTAGTVYATAGDSTLTATWT